MYKCDVTSSLPPLSQTVTPSRTPSALERDVLYERPKEFLHQYGFYIVNELMHQSILYLKNIPASISTTLFEFFRAGKSGEMS